jgi:phytoene synthase
VSAAAVEIAYAHRECERITRREAANFYYGIRLLPRFKREAMCAVYAFARRIDDIGDDERGLDREAKLLALVHERSLLAALEDGVHDPDDPVITALGHAQSHYDIPQDAFEVLIDGVELDVLDARYETFDELVRYCRCVAGSVGRMCAAIFTDGAASDIYALADDLGVAMQLTNILRDIVEDRENGRVYLPTEDLERFGCADLATADPERAAALIRFEAARASEWFERGMLITAKLDRRSAACVKAMTGIYGRILDRIIEDPQAVLRGRISLSAAEKTWVAARSLAGSAADALTMAGAARVGRPV